MMYEGSVDEVTISRATGWLYDRAAGSSLEVVAVLYGRVIGDASASLYRPDLEKVGFGDGLCGFDISFYEPLRDTDLSFVILRPRGSNLAIPRTTEDTYIDLIGSLTAKHPGAGRNRSVLGGHWTDRTDALHILAGRIQAGSCPASVQESLRRLIADGHVTLPAGTGGPLSEETLTMLTRPSTAQPGALDAAASELAGALMTENFAALLRAVFDDVPVAYSFTYLTGPSERMDQASAFEPFTSPAEVLAVYLPLGEAAGGRLDYVRDSHEFPEFGRTGRSRWTADGSDILPVIIAGREQPIDSVELTVEHVIVVSPGVIHRHVIEKSSPVARILFAPKRNMPVHFLAKDCVWHEYASGEGIRIRAC